MIQEYGDRNWLNRPQSASDARADDDRRANRPTPTHRLCHSAIFRPITPYKVWFFWVSRHRSIILAKKMETFSGRFWEIPGNVLKLELLKMLIDHKNASVFFQAVSTEVPDEGAIHIAVLRHREKHSYGERSRVSQGESPRATRRLHALDWLWHIAAVDLGYSTTTTTTTTGVQPQSTVQLFMPRQRCRKRSFSQFFLGFGLSFGEEKPFVTSNAGF